MAQLAEQLICNQQVNGSSPFISSIFMFNSGRMPEWLKGADCKSVDNVYDGSNPSSPTNALSQFLLEIGRKLSASETTVIKLTHLNWKLIRYGWEEFSIKIRSIFLSDPLAQLVEHLTFNQGVGRSSRPWVTIFVTQRAMRLDKKREKLISKCICLSAFLFFYRRKEPSGDWRDEVERSWTELAA